MKLDRRPLIVGVLVLAVGLAVYLRGNPGEDSPEHRTDSDALNGTSALPQLAQALGHPTTTLRAGFQPDLGMRVLFVFTPTTAFSREEARRLSDYVAAGGTLVYADEQGDAMLDAALQVRRQPGVASGDGSASGPMLAGVRQVSGGAAVGPLRPQPNQVVVLRSSGGQPIGLEQRLGRGRVITLADPLPLCNGYLDRADNGRLASDLVSLAGGGGEVAFDEYHHGVPGPSSPLTGWFSTAWGVALAWAVMVLFVGLLLRGRAFGPRLELPGSGERSSAEYVTAVGGLLRRTRAAGLTAQVLAGATRRALAARHGIAAGGDAFENTLRQRAPAEARELEAAEAELARCGEGEEALLLAARRLHRLAYQDRERP